MLDPKECQRLLTVEEVMGGYGQLSKLYPHVPSMSIWRAWEYAAYNRYQLQEPVLDVGCGDGCYFKLVWPDLRDVVGIDIDPEAVSAARASGVYRDVRMVSAQDMPFAAESFSSVFANCSLEHMNNLPAVLRRIEHVLKPGGDFLLSVVTEKFIEWSTLPGLLDLAGSPERAACIRNEYLNFHHLVSALSPASWMHELHTAGFEVVDYLPILPELIGRFDLFVDTLWHVQSAGSEFGATLQPYFQSLRGFPEALGGIIHNLMLAEKDWETTCGAVFYVRKRGGSR
jgi:SAM-dependent methyltransferase